MSRFENVGHGWKNAFDRRWRHWIIKIPKIDNVYQLWGLPEGRKERFGVRRRWIGGLHLVDEDPEEEVEQVGGDDGLPGGSLRHTFSSVGIVCDPLCFCVVDHARQRGEHECENSILERFHATSSPIRLTYFRDHLESS